MYSIVLNINKTDVWQKIMLVFASGEVKEAKCKITKMDNGTMFVSIETETVVEEKPKRRIRGSAVYIDPMLQDKVKNLLESGALSYEDVASEIGCSSETVRNFVNGKYNKASSNLVIGLKNICTRY